MKHKTNVAVECQFDFSPWGTGRRVFLIITYGRKWLRLINPATLTVGRVSRATYAHAMPRLARAELAQLELKARVAQYRRLGLTLPRGAAKAIRRVSV